MPTRSRPVPGQYPCGFCQTDDHVLCPYKIKDAAPQAPSRIWYCPCALAKPNMHSVR